MATRRNKEWAAAIMNPFLYSLIEFLSKLSLTESHGKWFSWQIHSAYIGVEDGKDRVGL